MTEELIAPPAATTAFRIPSLDGIRAISILLGFLAHTGVSVRVGGVRRWCGPGAIAVATGGGPGSLGTTERW